MWRQFQRSGIKCVRLTPIGAFFTASITFVLLGRAGMLKNEAELRMVRMVPLERKMTDTKAQHAAQHDKFPRLEKTLDSAETISASITGDATLVQRTAVPLAGYLAVEQPDYNWMALDAGPRKGKAAGTPWEHPLMFTPRESKDRDQMWQQNWVDSECFQIVADIPTADVRKSRCLTVITRIGEPSIVGLETCKGLDVQLWSINDESGLIQSRLGRRDLCLRAGVSGSGNTMRMKPMALAVCNWRDWAQHVVFSTRDRAKTPCRAMLGCLVAATDLPGWQRRQTMRRQVLTKEAEAAVANVLSGPLGQKPALDVPYGERRAMVSYIDSSGYLGNTTFTAELKWWIYAWKAVGLDTAEAAFDVVLFVHPDVIKNGQLLEVCEPVADVHHYTGPGRCLMIPHIGISHRDASYQIWLNSIECRK